MNQQRRLLVIDDDASVRESVVVYLEDSGFDVHAAASGKDGLEWLKAHSPDIVLTDLRMPDVDGLAVLKEVRRWRPQTPVIVISGMGVVRDVIEALRLGAADYLVKPLVDMEVLVHSINRALERLDLKEENLGYRSELEKANRELREYVRVLERDHKAGRRVQSKLLPKTPESFSGIDVSYRLIPSLYLSGDFIDYGLLSKRYFAFYLTDVSGHGAASAFVTVWLKQLVRRYFREQRIFDSPESFEQDAGKLMELINNEVIHSGVGCHMTCFVGVIDTHTMEMRYVFGGHLPFPLLISPEGTCYLTGKGKPVGIFENASWEVYSTQLPPKFSLVVFSDGILEVLPPEDLIDKEQHLLEVMTGHDGDVDSIADSIGVCGMDTAPDDIAILRIASDAFGQKANEDSDP